MLIFFSITTYSRTYDEHIKKYFQSLRHRSDVSWRQPGIVEIPTLKYIAIGQHHFLLIDTNIKSSQCRKFRIQLSQRVRIPYHPAIKRRHGNSSINTNYLAFRSRNSLKQPYKLRIIIKNSFHYLKVAWRRVWRHWGVILRDAPKKLNTDNFCKLSVFFVIFIPR